MKPCDHQTLVRAKTGGWFCVDTTSCEFQIPEPRPASLASKERNPLDAAVAERLEQLFDSSNYGSLEELQDALRDWTADLRSGAASILDYAPPAETECSTNSLVVRCRCGWIGTQLQLVYRPHEDTYWCPKCPTRFLSVPAPKAAVPNNFPAHICRHGNADRTCPTCWPAEKTREASDEPVPDGICHHPMLVDNPEQRNSNDYICGKCHARVVVYSLRTYSPEKAAAPPEALSCGPGTPWDRLCGEPSCAYCGAQKTEALQFPPDMTMAESHGDPRIGDDPHSDLPVEIT